MAQTSVYCSFDFFPGIFSTFSILQLLGVDTWIFFYHALTVFSGVVSRVPSLQLLKLPPPSPAYCTIKHTNARFGGSDMHACLCKMCLRKVT